MDWVDVVQVRDRRQVLLNMLMWFRSGTGGRFF